MCAFDSQHVKLYSIPLCEIFCSLFVLLRICRFDDDENDDDNAVVRSSLIAPYTIMLDCLFGICSICVHTHVHTHRQVELPEIARHSLTLLFLAIFDRRSRLLIFFVVSVHLFTLLLGAFVVVAIVAVLWLLLVVVLDHHHDDQ